MSATLLHLACSHLHAAQIRAEVTYAFRANPRPGVDQCAHKCAHKVCGQQRFKAGVLFVWQQLMLPHVIMSLILTFPVD